MRSSLIGLLAAVVLAGCSLVNPFVIDQRVREGRDRQDSRPVVDPGHMSFEEASRYAARVKQRYRDALGHQAQLQSWLGIGLIPLSAAAMGIGATGGPASAVLATGLTGAAGLGVGVWLSNRPRDAAYVAGIKAVTCAESAVTPLAFSDPEIQRFGANLTSLHDAIPPVQREVAAVAELADGLAVLLVPLPKNITDQYAGLLAEARAEIAAARSLVSSAEAAFVTGTELHRLMSGLGRRLALAIDKIVDTVDGIIVDTQRDPQALSAIIANLGGSYKMLTTVPDALKPRAAAPPSALKPQTLLVDPKIRERLDAVEAAALKLVAGLTRLRDREASLSSALRPVAAVINTVSKDAPLKALESCGVSASDIVTALSIDPAPPLPLAKPGSVGFVARGGVSPYGASIKGPSDRVTVTPAGPFSPAFTVTAAADAQAGTYVVTVFDGSNQIKNFEVTVDGATKDTGPPGAGPKEDAVPDAKKESFERFIDKIGNQVVEVPGTGVTLKIGEPKIEQGKVVVPAKVESVSEPKLDAFTVEAVKKALQDKALGSGISPSDIVIDVDALKKAAAAMPQGAPRAAFPCDRIALETPVATDSEPAFSQLPEHRRRQLQAALCLQERPARRGQGIDGVWGPHTKQALKQYQCRTGRVADGTLTQALIDELLARRDDEVRRQCLGR